MEEKNHTIAVTSVCYIWTVHQYYDNMIKLTFDIQKYVNGFLSYLRYLGMRLNCINAQSFSFPMEIPCWSKANTIFDYIIVSEMNLQSIFIGYIAICSKRYKIK